MVIASSKYNSLLRRATNTLPYNYQQRRWLAVKELSWCSPNRSPSTSTKMEKNAEQKKENHLNTLPSSKFGIIAAMDESRVIGISKQLPWHIPEDRKNFIETTKGCILVIGKNSFFESPDQSHLKSFGHVIVVSTTLSKEDIGDSGIDNAHLVRSFGEALAHNETLISSVSVPYNGDNTNFKTWIGGGQRLYEEAIRHPNLSEIRLTTVHSKTSDGIIARLPVAFFPAKYRWDNTFKEIKELRQNSVDETSGLSYTISVHRRRK